MITVAGNVSINTTVGEFREHDSNLQSTRVDRCRNLERPGHKGVERRQDEGIVSWSLLRIMVMWCVLHSPSLSPSMTWCFRQCLLYTVGGQPLKGHPFPPASSVQNPPGWVMRCLGNEPVRLLRLSLVERVVLASKYFCVLA